MIRGEKTIAKSRNREIAKVRKREKSPVIRFFSRFRTFGLSRWVLGGLKRVGERGAA